MKRMFSKLSIVFIIIAMFFLYKDVIYYHIPYNPLKKIYDTQPELKYIEYQILFRGLLVTRTEKYKSDIHYDILKYFADMDVVPLKNFSKKDRSFHNQKRFILFSIGEPYNKAITLRFINPNIFRISSDGILKDSYYKIRGKGLDFIYLSNTLKENNY